MTRLYSIGDVHEMTGAFVSALRYYADRGCLSCQDR